MQNAFLKKMREKMSSNSKFFCYKSEKVRKSQLKRVVCIRRKHNWQPCRNYSANRLNIFRSSPKRNETKKFFFKTILYSKCSAGLVDCGVHNWEEKLAAKFKTFSPLSSKNLLKKVFFQEKSDFLQNDALKK